MKNGRIWLALIMALLLALPAGGALADTVYKVGILQFMEHGALDASREFFLKALADGGLVEGENLEVTVLNPSRDFGVMQIMSSQLVQDGNMLMLGIATPAVQSLASATDIIPILGVAVTDYVGAGIIVSNEAPGINVSGTTDMNPIDKQLDLLVELVPDAKVVGIVYATAEDNSKIQADIAVIEAEKRGLTVIIRTVAAVGELQMTLESIMPDIDALYVPTDSTMAGAMRTVATIAEAHGVPTIVGEANMCVQGGLATVGLNYETLGYQTGLMALRILLEGANPAEMPIESQAVAELSFNITTAELLGIEIPQEMLDAAFIFE